MHSVVKVFGDWNKAYYGKPVLPPDVLVRGSAKNPHADKLLSTASMGTGK